MESYHKGWHRGSFVSESRVENRHDVITAWSLSVVAQHRLKVV